MKKVLILLFITAFACVSTLYSACTKPNEGETSDGGSASPKPVEPQIIVEPKYDITVNILTGEYGGSASPVAEVIESAAESVYGVRAISDKSLVMGSAVAIACVKAEKRDGQDENENNGEQSSNAGEWSGQGQTSGETSETEDSSEGEEVPENEEYLAFFVTCFSVIDGASEYVLTSPEGENYAAEFIGADPNSNVAVLMIKKEIEPAVFLSDSNSVRLGDEMFAVGYPLNAGAGVVKMTTLGAKEHDVEVGSNVYRMMILSDGLSAGYAGGAAYVINGGVVGGIVAQIDGAETDGYSFIIPSNVVIWAAGELISTYTGESYGYIEGNFYLGATYEDSKLATNRYVYVSSIDTSGSLYLGGLRVGDRITRIEYVPSDEDEENVFAEVTSKTEIEEFLRSLANLKIGDKLVFRIARDKLASTRTIPIVQYVYGAVIAEQ
ncbi:MAG: serine protease [Clostridia bacterium]|nr:serine protease [Clostridia bacterium]